MTLDCTKMFLESDRKQQSRVISFLYVSRPQRGVFVLPAIDKICRAGIIFPLFPAREKLTKDGLSQRLGKSSGTEDGRFSPWHIGFPAPLL